MPLTEKVSFETMFEKGNKLQIPKLIVWQFKIDQNQVLKVTISPKHLYSVRKSFYAKTDKQGRITIPKITRTLMAKKENPNLEGYIFGVWLEPA
jgi:hypothetical protein